MYINNIDWFDRKEDLDRKKGEEYNGTDKKRIKELLGDNLYGIAFISLKEKTKESIKNEN